MQQNNGHKQQENVLPSFHSLISTLGVSNDSNFPSINNNTSTWDGHQQPSTSSYANPSLTQFQSSLEPSSSTTASSMHNNNGTCTVDFPPLTFEQQPLNYQSPQLHNPFNNNQMYNSSSQHQSHVSIPILSASSLLLPGSPSQQENYPSPTQNKLSPTLISSHQHQQTHLSPLRRVVSNSPPLPSTITTPNRNAQIETQKKKKEKKIKFMPSNNFASLNVSSSQIQPPKTSTEDVEVTNVTFSMEKQSQPKKKRKSLKTKNSKFSSPSINQSESTNDSDYSSTGSIPLQNNTNCPSSSTDNSSQNASNPKPSNSGIFMEFIGTSTKKRKQYRDIINYKDEFFTDSYSAEKRLRESNTKYRSKQPLDSNKNKEK